MQFITDVCLDREEPYRYQISQGILSAIGQTPLVKLTRIFPNLHFDLYAKMEALNPGGSMKDRPAFNIIKRGMEAGLIRPETVIVESSSGNMGIGLAQACAYFGLRFICVVDPKATTQNVRLLKTYGAEVDMVRSPDPITHEYLQARIKRVMELRATIENSFWPNQYSNEWNPLAHHQTMHEIVVGLGGPPDYVFVATSTCGTLRGCAEYIREHDMNTCIIAVDALGSSIFGGGEKRKRLIPGHGAAVRPGLYQDGLADRCVHVTDLDCVVGCRRLVRREAILAGGSSGALISAIERELDHIPSGSTCALILPDHGQRYLDTIYSDEWVMDHFGEISDLWLDTSEATSCLTATY
jgi:2,3-diaminopropionate biosynthesis protein SbnA